MREYGWLRGKSRNWQGNDLGGMGDIFQTLFSAPGYGTTTQHPSATLVDANARPEWSSYYITDATRPAGISGVELMEQWGCGIGYTDNVMGLKREFQADETPFSFF